MDLGITGKVALVAASSKGLGRACAHELAREGARIVMCARGVEALQDAKEAIVRDTEAQVVAIPADLTEPKAVETVCNEAVRAFGRIDILVTNTGGPPAGLFDQHDAATWQAAVDQNLHSVVNLVRLVLPGMKERGWGRIINVTSIAVKQPVDNLILSNSVRAAVTGFARTLANEVAETGVTVNNVLPGYTKTQRVDELAKKTASARGITRDQAVATWESQIPMGRLGLPHEFAALVAFLASERASYITGTSIPVDGGWVKALY
jgi:3-oxoacyl-[acyl-carrier protein] reductase